jgi:hypothetical protein
LTFTSSVWRQRRSTKAEDFVGGFGPAMSAWIAEFGDRSMGVTLDLVFRQTRREALDLVDRRRGGRRKVEMPAGTV